MKKVFSFDVFFFLCFLFMLSTCQKKVERNVEVAFYYWKTSLDVSPFEENFLKNSLTNRVYLRFFDIDWDGAANEPLPLATLEVKTGFSDDIEIVPTIFITNRTFLNIDAEAIPKLAKNVVHKIEEIAAGIANQQIKEYQFDCDWTPKTKAKYFNFLKEIKSNLEEKSSILSSTIRLHQIKFFEKTGVPPVDRGVLMFYNMGDLEDINAENTILDLSIAKQYLINVEKYPLNLDLALPLFSWGVLIREGKMIKLINNLQAVNLNDKSRFSKIDEMRFEVTKSTYLQGHYLYQGDVIRLESASIDLLEKAADLLKEKFVNPDVTIIFYHLDSVAINHYPHEVLEAICNRFR